MSICKGLNCKAVDGVGHSVECLMDHNLAIHHNAGNNNTEWRYKGYKNEPLGKATDEQQAAWWEGRKASLYPPDNSITAKSASKLEALQAKLDAAEAHISELRNVLEPFDPPSFEYNEGSHELGDAVHDILAKTPVQSLVKVQADTITKLIADHSRSASIDGTEWSVIHESDAEKLIDELLGDTNE